jgi:hypothetical protein
VASDACSFSCCFVNCASFCANAIIPRLYSNPRPILKVTLRKP